MGAKKVPPTRCETSSLLNQAATADCTSSEIMTAVDILSSLLLGDDLAAKAERDRLVTALNKLAAKFDKKAEKMWSIVLKHFESK